ncbi:TetR/AcrR family transcriptional regulator [Aeromicrobium sp. YIM 150415]|uniref:TetR/AcrR family transcriptional regulator n=1 Tax=Aeromicrobium sp. YIM 150415 TaxID=2803912 RepID=UPI001965EF2F|nr:TetR/AcrR family transcriptional regulator [Aeromicrobium sp. YIM 150415]MBM9465421.1 TetR/AcrR family transcriptional regulator [Aeromicrobium sp. YIM 150415]
MSDRIAPRRREPRQSRSRQTVARIRQAAVDLLVDEGLDGLNTNAIADRAGVNISTLYGYFPDKHSIIVDLFESFETERSDAVLSATERLRDAEDWRGWMSDIIDRMASFRVEWPAGIILRRALVLNPELQALDDRSTELASQALARAFSERPQVDSDADLQRIALVTVTTITHLLDRAFMSTPPDLGMLEELKVLTERYLTPYLEPRADA